MNDGARGIENGIIMRQRVMGLVAGLAVLVATAMSAAGAIGPPSIWVELEEMRPPCKGDACTRELRPPGVVIVGSGLGAFAPVQVRFVSMDGTRESMVFATETYSAGGDFRLLTGERVCNDWLGSPLESSGLPDEHAWEVRAAPLTGKTGVAANGSNILYLYTCGDGGVG